MSSNYLVKSNEFEVPVTAEILQQADLLKLGENAFHLIYKNRSINARLLDADHSGKKLLLELEGESYQIEIKDPLDQMLDKMGFINVSNKHVKDIKAPMPGLVVEVSVQEGQSLKEGERLLILSAMKMENSILLHADAIIKKVHVTAGQPVEKGQLLVELE